VEPNVVPENLANDIVAWRRHLHRYPELGFEEHKTAAFVAERLKTLGLEVHTGVAETGVVGVLRAPSADLDAVLLRADMDALPIQEVPGREYGSNISGKMHACGHDGHMAMLLGAATLLVRDRALLRRDVVFCFQPAEEGRGGAREMVRAEILPRFGVGRAFALHLWSPFPVGTLHVRSGPIMAAQDEFEAIVHGAGGHGAAPHMARDPVLAASLAVVATQNVVSRFVDPIEPAVVTVGRITGGSAPNVIPETAELAGTMRSFAESVRIDLRERVEAAMRGAASSCGCELDFRIRPGYPAVVNDRVAVVELRDAATRILGAERVVEADPLAASEDFAYFLKEVPGAFALLGAGNVERGIVAPHHSPEFDLDESVLPVGARILREVAIENTV
jgi:amidohydrolase